MAHNFSFTVNVSLERESGKFASREEMAEAIISELESADPGSIDSLGPDGETTYNIIEFEVTEDA